LRVQRKDFNFGRAIGGEQICCTGVYAFGLQIVLKIIYTPSGHQIWAGLFAEPTNLSLPEFEPLFPGCGPVATVSELSWFLEF
jgi:hypothetical protein